MAGVQVDLEELKQAHKAMSDIISATSELNSLTRRVLKRVISTESEADSSIAEFTLAIWCNEIGALTYPVADLTPLVNFMDVMISHPVPVTNEARKKARTVITAHREMFETMRAKRDEARAAGSTERLAEEVKREKVGAEKLDSVRRRAWMKAYLERDPNLEGVVKPNKE